MDTINSQNLVNLFALRSTFNSELIKQFYATLYVSGEANDTSTWILEWMIQGQVFRMSSQEFMEVINIPHHTGQQDKIHLLADMTDGEFATLLDPEVTEDYLPENIRPKHLVFISKTWFYILSKTLLPLSNAHEESNIYPFVQHAIFKLSHGMVFDFEDCFLRTFSAADLPFTYKPYAPWLQAISNFGRSEDFVARHHPKLFTPPARDTLNMLR